MKSIASFFRGGGSSLIVLAPASSRVSDVFHNVEIDPHLRSHLMAEMQRFRGGVYLNDGAILAHELARDGRHRLPIDEESWHLLTLRPDSTVCGCIRFLERNTRYFDDLCVREAELMHSDIWAPKLRKAAELEMAYSKAQRISFCEVGGLAIAPDRRLTMEPLRTILASYSLAELLGSCSGFATATHRHGSAPILRKIGLTPVIVDGTELPAYYDPKYRCEMEVLRFDSRFPNPKFRNWINELISFLTIAPVICSLGSQPSPVHPSRDLPVGAIPTPALAGIF